MKNQDHRAQSQAIGLVASSEAALRQIGGLLGREGLGLSQAIGARSKTPSAGSDKLLAGVQRLQKDRRTELLILAADPLAPAAADRLLAQVEASDKPAVVCLLGCNPRLVWQAGAIPACRLDEAARRAVAWVRGWDQALISSQLEEEDEELAAQAAALQRRIGRGRSQVLGLLAPSLCHEARLMLDDLGVKAPFVCQEIAADAGATAGAGAALALAQALAAPGAAVALVEVSTAAGAGNLVDALAGGRGALPIVHLSAAEDPAPAATRLQEAGAVVAASNAAAARLAAMALPRR